MSTPIQLPNFSEIFENVAHQCVIARRSWPAGTMVFAQVPATIPLEVIPKMQSLPEHVRLELISRGKPISYSKQLAILHPDNSIHGWNPTPEDLWADDWITL